MLLYKQPCDILTHLEPQSRFRDNLLEIYVVCPQNGTAVLKGSRDHRSYECTAVFYAVAGRTLRSSSGVGTMSESGLRLLVNTLNKQFDPSQSALLCVSVL